MSNAQNISVSRYFCPLCHQTTFREHWMGEYRHLWNKCPSCGYMELKKDTENRILSVFAPDKLTEPFNDPLTPELIQSASDMGIRSKRIKHNKDNNPDTDYT